MVIGRGILGLSSAHALALAGQAVDVVSSPHWPRASAAAAANLALKAQSFARHPHFALKLRMRERYADWVQEVEKESARLVPFWQGRGIALFDSCEASEAQWRRVRQPEADVLTRGLPPQSLSKLPSEGRDSWPLCYERESWVDADALLSALETACLSHGVRFFERQVDSWQALSELVDENTHVLVCAGAGTPRLLQVLELEACAPPLRTRLARPRWSAGSVFVSRSHSLHAPNNAAASFLSLLPSAALVDLPERCEAAPTLSGPGLQAPREALFLSSTTLRLKNPGFENPSLFVPDPSWAEENGRLLRATKEGLQFLGLEDPVFLWEQARHGVRVGFGHEELVACALEPCKPKWTRHKAAFLLAGAHKSGFLFAPAASELLASIGLLGKSAG
ncbi:MAG: FAD-dependent oxidoreductase [Silvanigrellales bacterium]|nr:FAD-dependent oxidoreductase [Silvanigrellales bacterium]